MAPVPLPNIASQFVRLPPAPSDPPSQTDIAKAKCLEWQIMNHRVQNDVTDKDVYEVAVYDTKLMAQLDPPNADIEPAWFTRAMNNMKEDISTLKDNMATKRDIVDIKRDLNILKVAQGKTQRIAALDHNMRQGPGDGARFEVVPFPNGEDPTMPPHNLPPLSSPTAIRNLAENDRDMYCQGYYPNRALTRYTINNEKTRMIFEAIGSSV